MAASSEMGQLSFASISSRWSMFDCIVKRQYVYDMANALKKMRDQSKI